MRILRGLIFPTTLFALVSVASCGRSEDPDRETGTGAEQGPSTTEGFLLHQRVGNIQVSIIARCMGDQADVSVKPWARAVQPGSPVEFRLVGGSNGVSEVTLRPKPDAADPNHWPFENGPITLQSGQSTSTSPSPDPGLAYRLVRYPYEIYTKCAFPMDSISPFESEIIIDPEIIIRGTGSADSTQFQSN